MEKVLFIVFERGDQQPASLMTTDEIIGRSTQLGVERYPDVSLQVEEREITDQWQRRGPGAYRMQAVLSVWTECADDVSDVEQVVSAISSDYAGFVVTEAMPKGRSAGFVSSVDPQPGIKVTSLLVPSILADTRRIPQPLVRGTHADVLTHPSTVDVRPQRHQSYTDARRS